MSIYDIFILLGGVGLFLYGMTIMSSGLKNACGDNLKVILGKATKNKVTSILAGIAVTIFVQSSSATDVMVIGFSTDHRLQHRRLCAHDPFPRRGDEPVPQEQDSQGSRIRYPRIRYALPGHHPHEVRDRASRRDRRVPRASCCRARLRQRLSSRPLQCRTSSATRQQYTWSSVQPSVLLCPTFWQALQPTATASAARC